MHLSHLANLGGYQKDQANGASKDHHLTINGNNHHHSQHSPFIKDVWEDNFEEEFRIIMDLIETYPVVAMDTEFPGTVYEFEDHDMSPMGHYELKYKKIKMNVDKLKVIQVGISLADDEGNMPPNVTTWQFNLKFNLSTDEYSKDAIKLLIDAGLKFDQHAKKGISPLSFAEYLIGTGLVMNKEIKWIVFDGGYDFAYLIKILEQKSLPENETQFYHLLSIYFPNFYDVKHMVRDVEDLRVGGLSKIANELNVKRIGTMHQAGSDALLTVSTFFKFLKIYVKNSMEKKYMNVLDGIPQHAEELWKKTLVSDYSYMMFNGYGMHNMVLMDTPYYNQPELIYNGAIGNNMYQHYNTSFGGPSFQEQNQKLKKYENQGGKLKNQKI